jgi:hypothetical protein
MRFHDIDLIYVPITKPIQVQKVARWMIGKRGASSRYLHTDYTIVSIGPHLKHQEVELTPVTLNASMRDLRLAVGPTAPIVAAEFVHAVNTHPSYAAMVDKLMIRLRKLFSQHHVGLVPQRHITKKPYVMSKHLVQEADVTPPPPRYAGYECGYYDLQHPGFRCQSVATELLVAAALGGAPGAG